MVLLFFIIQFTDPEWCGVNNYFWVILLYCWHVHHCNSVYLFKCNFRIVKNSICMYIGFLISSYSQSQSCIKTMYIYLLYCIYLITETFTHQDFGSVRFSTTTFAFHTRTSFHSSQIDTNISRTGHTRVSPINGRYIWIMRIKIISILR